MKVLLTGGAGFIGSHTAVELISAGFEVVIADNLSNSNVSVLDRLKEITGCDIPFYRIDVADSGALDNLFTREKPEAVIHFAGLKAVGESVKKPLEYYRVNLDTTFNTLETMRRHGVANIIFSSSATVYGPSNRVPLTEDMPTGGCTNPYGETKLMIERILTDLCAADERLSAVLLRYFNPIGAHESGLIGEEPQGIPNNLMPYICLVAAGKLPRLNVFGNDYPTPDGTGVRDYIHVTDLARGHVAALNYAVRHKGAEAINLGTGKGTGVLELIRTFSRVNNIDVPYTITARRMGDIAECYASAEKAERLLGWKAEKDINDMCRDSWNWTRKHIR